MSSTSDQGNNKKGWYAEDDKAFIDILQSMGVTQFDPLLPIALNEYARSK